MKQQSILLTCLLLVPSLSSIAQPKNKSDFESLWRKPNVQVIESQSPPEPEPLSEERYGDVRIFAVVVGVSQYTAMPVLRFTDDDARLFFAHLASEKGGDIPASRMKLLLEEKATYENITQALEKIAYRADENDVIIFYFSGHGLSRAFLPFDYDGLFNQLGHEEVLAILQSSRARHKVCIADACHSGGIDYSSSLAAKGVATHEIERFYDLFEQAESGTALLMSSSAEEASLEDRALRHGVFTHFLLQGISGLADHDRDGIVNIRELFWYVHHYVVEYTEGAQSPVLTGNYDDNLPVAIKSAE